MQAVSAPRLDAASLGFTLCCVAAAAMVAWMSVAINRERACTLRESVAQPWCPASPAEGSLQETQALRMRIARDPGDTNAITQLALADRTPARAQSLDVAGKLVPRDPNLMMQRASAALERQDWPGAIPLLVELVEYREVPAASAALAWLVLNGHAPLLEQQVVPGTRWLPRLLTSMRGANIPFSAALPLVTKGARLGVIDEDTMRAYVRELKSTRSWGDAYALWLSMHGSSVPLLFNASFDRAFEQDGFDWEVPARTRRSGVIVERRRAEQRGAVLDLQFNGRAIELPILRQYLFIAPGRYRLHGDYLARQFRMEEGLAWKVRCDASTAAISVPIRETAGLWRSFDIDFTIPPDCGLVASLQLETTSPTDATLGGRGRVAFDAFSLERTGP